MPLWLFILVFHPVPPTIIALVAAVWLLRRIGLWTRYKRSLLLVAALLYATDTAIALPRLIYAWQLPDRPIILKQLPLPTRLVLVGAQCKAECHDGLLSGAIEEVILVEPTRAGYWNPPSEEAVRYRAGWQAPGTCPQERERMIGLWDDRLRRQGFCPIVEPIAPPTDGIFIVESHFLKLASERAAPFTSPQLTSTPPGRAIRFVSVEVQRRERGRIELLASRRRYQAPGLLGLPPLIGCWDRPDSIIWIMPPGDTGCGFWRRFTSGGDLGWQGDASWVFSQVFTPPGAAARTSGSQR